MAVDEGSADGLAVGSVEGDKVDEAVYVIGSVVPIGSVVGSADGLTVGSTVGFEVVGFRVVGKEVVGLEVNGELLG